MGSIQQDWAEDAVEVGWPERVEGDGRHRRTLTSTLPAVACAAIRAAVFTVRPK